MATAYVNSGLQLKPRTDTLCRLCGAATRIVADLGVIPASNAYTNRPILDIDRVPIALCSCVKCGFVALTDTVSPTALYGQNHELTGKLMSGYHAEYGSWVKNYVGSISNPYIVDIGSNDGGFLSGFQKDGWTVLGVEPADEPWAASMRSNIPAHQGFFTREWIADRYLSHTSHRPNVITANRVWANVEDVVGASWAVAELLAGNGYFFIETGYLPPIVDKMLIETIYPEHISYDLLTPLVSFFKRFGLEVVDAYESNAKGGSLRVIVRHEGHRVQESNIKAILKKEDLWLNSDPWTHFRDRIDSERQGLQGKLYGKVAGYGAGVPGIALTHYLGLEETLVWIVDDAATDQGKYMPGTNIQVTENGRLKEADTCVILAHRYAKQIQSKNTGFSKWLVPFHK